MQIQTSWRKSFEGWHPRSMEQQNPSKPMLLTNSIQYYHRYVPVRYLSTEELICGPCPQAKSRTHFDCKDSTRKRLFRGHSLAALHLLINEMRDGIPFVRFHPTGTGADVYISSLPTHTTREVVWRRPSCHDVCHLAHCCQMCHHSNDHSTTVTFSYLCTKWNMQCTLKHIYYITEWVWYWTMAFIVV